MILRKGQGSGKQPILRAKTVEMMSTNQIGELGAGKLKSARPAISADVDLHPGFVDKWGLGFLINTTAYQGGRSAGVEPGMGRGREYVLLDRPEARNLRSDHDAVFPVRRSRSGRDAG